MSYCIHVAKKYEVEFSDGRFSNKQSAFEDLLESLGVGIIRDENGSDFEVYAPEMETAIEVLKNLETVETGIRKEIENAIEGLQPIFELPSEEHKRNVIRTIERLYNEADKRDGYLHFFNF